MLNYLQPAEYGVLALLTGLTATIGLYADLGIERSLPRFIPEVERREGRAGVARFLWRVIGLKLILVLLCIVGLQLFSAPLVGRVVANEQVYLERARQPVATLEAQGAPADKLDKARNDRAGKAQALTPLADHGRLFPLAVGARVPFDSVS